MSFVLLHEIHVICVVGMGGSCHLCCLVENVHPCFFFISLVHALVDMILAWHMSCFILSAQGDGPPPIGIVLITCRPATRIAVSTYRRHLPQAPIEYELVMLSFWCI